MRRKGIFACAAAILIVGTVLVVGAPIVSGSHAAPYTPLRAPSISTRLLTDPIADSAPGAAQLRLGQYLVRLGDCASCHTREGGAFLAGGFALNTPFGTIYSTNLTADRETGIGAWTPEKFYAALHEGKGSQGPLYPAMPYPYTTRATRADTDAILAFLKTVPPVRQSPPPNALQFPFNVRTLIDGWNLLYFNRGEFTPVPAKPAEWNRGAYLVEGLGHCGACHTPKNKLAGDLKNRPLHGGTLDNWVAPDLTANPRTGLGSWSAAEIIEYLKTGRNSHANAGGAMAEVVSYSTSLLSDADLHAIATYLKDQPASPDASPAAPDAGAMKRGAAIFSDACTSCHMEQGAGQARTFPPLRDNAVSQQADPTGILHIILAGDRTAPTASRPSALAMPSFAWKLSNQQIADVATYVRNSQGNRAEPVTTKQAADMRKSLGLENERLTDGSTDR